ncbi:CBS domain-containing protein [Thalassobacillus sp. CUG 92003]|uniref:CBS domain-containing protein n=1 Tax=Thalassobacillus sp. CUG 92003 TaxID=2736641 RepID=UPI0015E740DD|nr:CBS domain-containing protein [Thalassobacillus sp. CUG 92003]
MGEDRYGTDMVERFELAFNQIHHHLKILNNYPKNDNFMELMQQSKAKHSVIRQHFEQLKQLAKLRNAIVHERIRDDYYIAYPHLEVVETIEKIKQTLDQPPKTLEWATTPVLYYRSYSPLSNILDAFTQHRVSQFPVYDKEHQFLGLLTNDGLVNWLAHNQSNGSISTEDVQASHVLEFEQAHNVHFLDSASTIFDLEEAFERNGEAKSKLKAVIITDGGNPNKEPVGIVTAWDLIKIDHPL